MSGANALVLVPADCTALVDGRLMTLTPAEFVLLVKLASANGEPVGHGALFDALYGGRVIRPKSNSIEVLISRLRKKLVAVSAADAGIRLRTKRSFGYRLVMERAA